MQPLVRFSQALAKLEQRLAGVLCFLVFALICANIVIRSFKLPIYWIDESAVFLMICMGFLAGSCAIQTGTHVSVTLVSTKLPKQWQQRLTIVATLIMLLFGLCLCWLSWHWFEPLLLLQTGGDTQAFAQQTMNFVYSEPTATMGIKKFWFWLIMPWFSLSLTLHSLARLASQYLEQPSTTATQED